MLTRGKEIIKLVAKGSNNKEIADKLFISKETVRNTFTISSKTTAKNKIHVLNKFNVKNTPFG
jgi:DNA-binding CsgD family transcriptional regulator